jgi:proteasome lid subunit RPN8/RPN11
VSISIPDDAIARMGEECARGYPEECCGALLGDASAADRAVVSILPIVNERSNERQTRYLIGPEEYREADTRAREEGLDIIGFYHSHPDHPAVPSTFDRDHAWPWYIYVIVPVKQGEAGRPRAWRLKDDRTRFEEIAIVRSAAGATSTEEAR